MLFFITSDRVWYNASQEMALYNWYDPDGTSTTEWGIPDMVYIGPSFFEGFLNFPGSHWSWQVNFGNTYGKEGGLDNAIEVAQLVLEYIQDRLETFEIGNEPNLMPSFAHRNSNYSMAEYVREWNEYADAISERVLKGNRYGLEETRIFQTLTTSGTSQEEWNL